MAKHDAFYMIRKLNIKLCKSLISLKKHLFSKFKIKTIFLYSYGTIDKEFLFKSNTDEFKRYGKFVEKSLF